jgi:hypothetical protein
MKLRSVSVGLCLFFTAPVAALCQGSAGVDVTRDEYEIWAAALKHLVGPGTGGIQLVVDSLAGPIAGTAEGVLERTAALGIPREMAVAATSRDSVLVPIPLEYLRAATRLPIVISSEERRALAQAVGVVLTHPSRQRPALAHLSRVTFDAARLRAIVDVAYICGGLCGHEAIVLLKRDPDGHWRVQDTSGMMFF